MRMWLSQQGLRFCVYEYSSLDILVLFIPLLKKVLPLWEKGI